jgi:hypothetical protein
LILRNRFEKEIKGFAPDLKQDFRTQIEPLEATEREIQGMLNQLSGKLAEHQLAATFLSRKFREVDDRRAAILSVQDKSWTPDQSTNEKKQTCNIP